MHLQELITLPCHRQIKGLRPVSKNRGKNSVRFLGPLRRQIHDGRISSSTHTSMTDYCDVAVPVPLDQLFTYKLGNGISSEPGGRVLVPFRQRRLVGIVTELHDRAPAFAAKNVIESPDDKGSPALTAEMVRPA